MFKVGDRVEVTKEDGYYSIGASGVIDRIDNDGDPWVKFDKGRFESCSDSTWCVKPSHLKLITEEPMNVITALEKSITHWQEIVAVFADTKTKDSRAWPSMAGKHCALCSLFNAKEGCGECPLVSCGSPNRDGSKTLWQKAKHATTNAEAYTASQAMLSRLEELLVEEQAKAKKEEAAIRVGDIVLNVTDAPRGKKMVGYSGVVTELIGDIIHYQSINGRNGGSYKADLILIHRPTKEAK